MPRTSERTEILEGLETVIESLAWAYVLSPLTEEDDVLEEYLDDLLTVHDVVVHHYPSRGGSTGHHGDDSLDACIHESPDTTFLTSFRMHRASFWQLVELLTNAGGEGYWGKNHNSTGCPIYQQIAVGLYVLGGGGTAEEPQIPFNIGHGTVSKYAWRTIELLASLLAQYVRWPAKSEGTVGATGRAGRHHIFRCCVGFLDGLNIVLRDKPIDDPEAYFSRGTYGFNLQAICDWDGQFIWAAMGYTAATHDSTAFKLTEFYRSASKNFDPEEYLLADEAYSLDRHIITPYKEPASRQPENAAFNHQLSIPRAKIGHAFGVLKARWSSERSQLEPDKRTQASYKVDYGLCSPT